mgnify:CR=1 FL=1
MQVADNAANNPFPFHNEFGSVPDVLRSNKLDPDVMALFKGMTLDVSRVGLLATYLYVNAR